MPSIKVVNVEAADNYTIKVAFEDGVFGTVDLGELVEKGIFRQLKDERAFQGIYVNGAAIAWSEELEIDADNIYADWNKAVKQESLLPIAPLV